MSDFEDRYEELYVSALRAARRVVGDRETARDVAAEAMAVERHSRWRGRGSWATLRVETSSDGAVVAVSPG